MLRTDNIAWRKFFSLFVNIVKRVKEGETQNCTNTGFSLNFSHWLSEKSSKFFKCGILLLLILKSQLKPFDTLEKKGHRKCCQRLLQGCFYRRLSCVYPVSITTYLKNIFYFKLMHLYFPNKQLKYLSKWGKIFFFQIFFK